MKAATMIGMDLAKNILVPRCFKWVGALNP